MRATRSSMLARVHARDPSANGAFYTGVLSTGIFCLPSCPARHPREENIRFFATADAASAAGLRPCKRCRPDLYAAGRDPELDLVRELTARARAHPADFAGVADLARAAGLGATRLTELFRRHYHQSPADWLRRARVEAVQRALAAPRARVLDAGLGAGFESSSALHDAFRAVAAMAPGEYRGMLARDRFQLELPADFRADLALSSWRRFEGSPSERADGARLSLALELDGRPAVLSIALQAARAACQVELAGAPGPRVMGAAHAAALRTLGLGQDPGPFERRVARDARLRPLIAGRAGLRVAQTADAFEGLVWVILGQQVNVAFAATCRARLVDLCGRPAPLGLRAHPTAARVAELDPSELLPLQLSRRKAEYLVGAARAIRSGQLELELLARDSAVGAARALDATRGLGPWSVGYLLMRSFGLSDCVPVGDAGLTLALQRFFKLGERPDAARTRELMAPFAPHRSLATFHLWKTLGDPP